MVLEEKKRDSIEIGDAVNNSVMLIRWYRYLLIHSNTVITHGSLSELTDDGDDCGCADEMTSMNGLRYIHHNP